VGGHRREGGRKHRKILEGMSENVKDLLQKGFKKKEKENGNLRGWSLRGYIYGRRKKGA